ncbi:hypothetical protein AB0Q95_13215 [Streptomyces sp. NPDC059900]|uniref:hypothetical protein n=1 Tax=Streptomyces sp. NPDC059900 TaxID=3155816 RepID=UPI003414930D
MPDTPAHPPAVPPLAALVGTAPDHPRSLLYTCHSNSATAARKLADLRGFAEAHGWPVLHEVYDPAPPETPRRRRIGWCTVEQLVLRGEVNTLIAPAEQEMVRTPAEQGALRIWLRGTGTCALYPQDCHRRYSCVQLRAKGAPA